MTVTTKAIMHAINRIAAVGPAPRDPQMTLGEWEKAMVHDPWFTCTQQELELAVTRWIGEQEKIYTFPGPGPFKAMIKARRSPPPPPPEEEVELAPPGSFREALRQHGIDLDNPPEDILAARARERREELAKRRANRELGEGGDT